MVLILKKKTLKDCQKKDKQLSELMPEMNRRTFSKRKSNFQSDSSSAKKARNSEDSYNRSFRTSSHGSNSKRSSKGSQSSNFKNFSNKSSGVFFSFPREQVKQGMTLFYATAQSGRETKFFIKGKKNNR